MAAQVKATPDGYHAITPYLIVRGGAAAITFYRKVFGADERMRLPGPDGKIGHAEIAIGDSLLMLADENPEHGAVAPGPEGSSAVTLHLYVNDANATVRAAEAAGATVLRPVETKFYGDRSGTVRDPFGHVWHVSTHVENVAPEEIARRAAALAGG